MHSCGSTPCRRRVATSPTGVLLLVLFAGAALIAAEPAEGPASMYRRILQQETTLRGRLDAASATRTRTSLLERVHALVADYEHLSDQFRSSGYSDNALWQGAMLSADVYWQFGDAGERRTARRLLDQLVARFPSSSLVARVADVRKRLDGGARPATITASARTSTNPRPATKGATLTAIRREVLPDAVRLTLVLERETLYSSERLEHPARLSITLRDTDLAAQFKETASLSYASDIVRKVRVAKTAKTNAQIVIDLDRAGRYSIYPVYSPYRLVIDVERAGTGRPRAPLVAATSPAKPAPATDSRNRTGGIRSEDTGRPAPSTGAAASGPAALRTTTVPPGRAAYSLSRQLGLGAARIVIDPGHGGHDPGAQVPGLDESALVLDVALRLEQRLKNTPGVEVILTRRTNAYVPLDERTAIANRARADLFLSIHANASPNPDARGIETYFLDFAPNADAEAIAARENADSGKTMRNLSDIVRAITLNDKIDESRKFALRVQSGLYAQLRRTNTQARSLGVKKAPFQVLIGATMPSVLAEISFLTNEHEADLLESDSYRDEIASALYDGVMGYQKSLKVAQEAGGKATD
jgi:N-acetylmuramoyl-L-alanine amidase